MAKLLIIKLLKAETVLALFVGINLSE